MKKWLMAVVVITVLATMWLPKAEAKILDDLEFVHGVQLGMVDDYNSVDSTGVWGMTETLYYKGFKKVHPGIQVGFTQAITANPREINDKFYALALARVPYKKINLYAGAGVGLGSQFTHVMSGGEQAQLLFPVVKVGAEYMITKRIGLGLEYLFSMGELKQNAHAGLATLAFHF